MPLNTQISAAIAAALTGTAIGGAQAVYNRNKVADIVLTDGSGSNQASKIWDAVRSVATAANDDLDLAGVLTDPFGATVTFATIKAILIRSDGANTTNLTIGNATSNQFVGPFGAAAHTITIRPGGAFLIAAPQTGYTVTASTGDIFRVANSAGATAVYGITVIGT